MCSVFIHAIKISFILTPFQPPTLVSNTSIGIELNFNSVGAADKLSSPASLSKAVTCPKYCNWFAISLTDYDFIFSWFAIKVREANPDSVALRNLDFLDQAEVVWIVFGEVRRSEDAACWLLSLRRTRTLEYS